MAKNVKKNMKKDGEDVDINKEQRNVDKFEPISSSSIQGFHKTEDDGFAIIDEEAVTPRAFDRTKKTTTRETNERNTNVAFRFSESFGDPVKPDQDQDKDQDKDKDKDRSFDDFCTENEKKEKENDEQEENYNTNEFLNRQETLINVRKEVEVEDKNDIHIGNSTNDAIDYTGRDINDTTGTNSLNSLSNTNVANAFDFGLDETPIKTNRPIDQNEEVDSSVKKYRTPGEIDMLQPDENLIGNKCMTITNYVSPPKYVKRIGSYSRFPLSGDGDVNPVDYNSFKSMFKNCACVISEQEYLESSSKGSNTNLMDGLVEEEDTDGEKESETGSSERDVRRYEDREMERVREMEKERETETEIVRERENRTDDITNRTEQKSTEERVQQNVEHKGRDAGIEEMRRQLSETDYNLHETPNKFSRSNTAFPTTGNNRSGSSPNRNGRTRLGRSKPMSTSKLLDLLNIENDKKDKDKNAKRSLSTDKKTKEGSNVKKAKIGNEKEDDKYIDFEVKPVFQKDMEIKEKGQKGVKENEKENTKGKKEIVAEVETEQATTTTTTTVATTTTVNIPKQITMDELIRKEKNPNPLQFISKIYSEELNIVFKKGVCERAHKLFYAYNNILYMMTRRNLMNEPLYFRVLRTELRKLGGGSAFTEDVLLQLAWLAPCLIVVNKVYVGKQIAEKNAHIYTEFNDNKKIEDIEIRECFNGKINVCKYTQAEKLNVCKKIIISWINIKHNEFLKKKNPEFYLPKYFELKKWHSEFNFDEVIFPTIELKENKVAARLSFIPQESNTEDFIVENDSPLKTVTLDFESNQRFVSDMEQEKTRTPLGRNRRKSVFGGAGGSTSPIASGSSSPFNFSSPKKETKNMKTIREGANRKKIIAQIKNELDEEEQKILNEKKYWESAKRIGEIIHEYFVVEKIYVVTELSAFAKKISEKYKSTQQFDLDEKKTAQIIQELATHIPDINIKPAIIDKSKVNLSVKSKKNLHFFLEPVAKKVEAMTKRYQELKANKENRLKQLWEKHNVSFEITENMKKFFLNPGTLTISDL